ncbi:MAG: hypothetical protein IT537_03295 [Hyphomicrobiales bacterium]|nr:hypothetical protein [Hyphomicrobiales bacterium]
MVTRRESIETLLHWAYRDELPKRQLDCSWATMFSSAAWQLGCRVDQSSSGESFPVGAGPPDPDALLLDYAVGCLPAQVRLGWPHQARELLGHLWTYLRPTDVIETRWAARMTDHRSARVTDRTVVLLPGLTIDLIELVRMYARLGTRPVWDVGPIRIVRVNAANGKPLVMVGQGAARRHARSPRNGMYETGAYGELRLEPAALEILSARFEYASWRAALVALASGRWKYGGIAPLPPAAAAAPWVVDDEVRPAVVQMVNLLPQRGTSNPRKGA